MVDLPTATDPAIPRTNGVRSTDSPRKAFFTQFARLTDEEAVQMAHQVWDDVNGPNLALNIGPTKGRATAILEKGPDHAVRKVWVRRI